MLIQLNPGITGSNDSSGQKIVPTSANSSSALTDRQLDVTRDPSKSENTNIAVACNTPFVEKPAVTQTRYDDGTVVVETNTPVYLKKPGTTGKLCIKYTDPYGGQSYSGEIYSEVVAGASDKEKVTITPYPNQVSKRDYYFTNAADAVANKTSFDVVYTISAPLDSEGFYGIWPLGFCLGLPLAIGHGASEINYSSDFAWQSGTYYCLAASLETKIVGLSGIDLSYVTSQSKANIGYEITGVHGNVTRIEPPSNASTTATANQNITTVTFAVHFHTYDSTINVIADARDFEIAHFGGNPQFKKIDQCSWVPTNDTALELAGARSIYDDKFGHDNKHVKIDSAPEKILAHTNDYFYTFKVTLTDLPVSYYALQPVIFITDAEEPVDQFGISTSDASIANGGTAIANYFPVTIGDTLPPPLLVDERGYESSSTLEGLYERC